MVTKLRPLHFGVSRKLMQLKVCDVFWCLSDPGWIVAAFGCLFEAWAAGCTAFVQHLSPFTLRSLHRHSSKTHHSILDCDHRILNDSAAELHQVVKTFIVLTPQFVSHDPDQLTKELQQYVKSVTTPYKYPRKVEFVPELPKTLTSNIKRNKLWNMEFGQM
ncbi:acyl-CoA synthetase medium chain family member 1 [Phyllostomus discolor]|uniref:Acyl-CoA synthetase medium chain family member 1 n=1 Tax=Phyllostomus discolor TaxID=89673 RepID=A0A834B438_9CHIR|nr:acyl-CoA synthetase medium chain family member 1 [Phyllostomus discolor]